METHLVLTSDPDEGGETWVSVEADPDTPIAEVADLLASVVGRPAGDVMLIGPERWLAPRRDTRWADAGFRHGDRVAVVAPRAAERWQQLWGTTANPPVGQLLITGGPARGERRALRAGTQTIGRTRGRADVVLPDRAISGVHASVRLHGDAVYLSDLNSRNGLRIGRRGVHRPTLLEPGEVVTIGDSTCVIVPPEPGDSGGRVGFHRPPRVKTTVEPVDREIPDPPQEPAPSRLPMVASIAPLLMAGIMFALTRSVLSIVFMTLSPVVAVGSYIETRRFNERGHRAKLRRWWERVEQLGREVDAAQTEELCHLEDLHPPLPALQTAGLTRSRLLWDRHRGDDDLLALRIGLGSRESRHRLRPPRRVDDERLAAELAGLTDGFRSLSRAPLTVDLARLGAIGVTARGPNLTASEQSMIDGVVRGLVTRTALLHSPAEVVICAIVAEQGAERWSWLRWLPHTRSPASPVGADHVAVDRKANDELLTSLCRLVERRRGAGRSAEERARAAWPAVVVVLDEHARIDRSALAPLLEAEPELGVHTIWLGTTSASMPKACGAEVTVLTGNTGLLTVAGEGARHDLTPLDAIDLPAAVAMARTLAPIVDLSNPAGREADLPSRISLPDLLGCRELLDQTDPIVANWRDTTHLSAPVARATEGNLDLDLRMDGPHGLVAGTTGAGKSEFLQTLVLSLALHHSPERLNFLLVDYKGGSAFGPCSQLIHCVGMVTDLDPHLVRRVLQSLRAELTRREHLLNEAKAKDLVTMELDGHPGTPPSLLIVVDEFAALAKEIPEFVEGVVDIAQRGRSLGLHLLLATQRPAGVITDNIRANMNLRIALRVAEESESSDVLGDPSAAAIDRSQPGRGLARLGPRELIAFQAAYAGNLTTIGAAPKPPTRVRSFGAGRPTELAASAPDEVAEEVSPDINRLLPVIDRAAEQLGIRPPRKPWLPALTSLCDLTVGLERPTDGRVLPIGIADHPTQQRQAAASVDFAAIGHLLVVGAGGSGKTSLLRTIAAVTGQQTEEAVAVHGLDFAGRNLMAAEALPTVGSIIDGDDYDRVTRLLRTLSETIRRRSLRMAELGVNDLSELRAAAPEVCEPRTFLLIDGLSTFLAEFERTDGGRWIDLLPQLLTDGRAVGVHVVATANRRTGLPLRLTSQFQRSVVLRLAETEEYAASGVPADVLTTDSPPGRAHLDGAETQLALIGSDPSGNGQRRAMEALAAEQLRVGVTPTPPIEPLPTELPFDTLPATGRVALEAAPIGVRGDDLGLASIDLSGGLFGIFGPPRSGRSTALRVLALAAASAETGRPILHVAGRTQPPPAEPFWTAAVSGAEQAVPALDDLADKVAAGQVAAPMVFVDDLTDAAETGLEGAIERLIELGRERPLTVVATGDAAAARSAYGSLITRFRRAKNGLLLVPDLGVDGDVFGVPLPRSAVRFVPGRGYLVRPGEVDLVQLALP